MQVPSHAKPSYLQVLPFAQAFTELQPDFSKPGEKVTIAALLVATISDVHAPTFYSSGKAEPLTGASSNLG